MVKSKLLEFDKTLEDEVCSNVLFRLHKVIDESFPTAAQASGKFSQTVVANYDKINPALVANQNPNVASTVPPTPPLPQSIPPRGSTGNSNTKASVNPSYSPYSSPYSQQIFSSAADSVYVPKSKQKKSFFRSFIKTKKPKKFAIRDGSSTDFEKSRSDEIFSDRYLNKVARRSKPGIIRTLLKLTLFALVIITITVFVMGKQKRALELIRDFPTYYSQQLKPKLIEFKSYFNSDSKTESQNENQEPSQLK